MRASAGESILTHVSYIVGCVTDVPPGLGLCVQHARVGTNKKRDSRMGHIHTCSQSFTITRLLPVRARFAEGSWAPEKDATTVPAVMREL